MRHRHFPLHAALLAAALVLLLAGCGAKPTATPTPTLITQAMRLADVANAKVLLDCAATYLAAGGAPFDGVGSDADVEALKRYVGDWPVPQAGEPGDAFDVVVTAKKATVLRGGKVYDPAKGTFG